MYAGVFLHINFFFILEEIKLGNIFEAWTFGFFYCQWNLSTNLKKLSSVYCVHNACHVSKQKCRSNLQFIILFHRSLMISLRFIAMPSNDNLTLTKYRVFLSNWYYKSCTASVAIVLDRINHVIGVQTQII